MNVVTIEFDEAKFGTVKNCLDWLEQNEKYSSLLELKSFKLTKGYCRFLCGEKRKIFTWSKLWTAQELKIQRPMQYVVVVVDVGSQRWTDQDMPLPLPSTQKKKLQQEQNLFRKEIAKIKRQEQNKKRKRQLRESESGEKKNKKVESKIKKVKVVYEKAEPEDETPITPLKGDDAPFPDLPTGATPSVVELMEKEHL